MKSNLPKAKSRKSSNFICRLPATPEGEAAFTLLRKGIHTNYGFYTGTGWGVKWQETLRKVYRTKKKIFKEFPDGQCLKVHAEFFDVYRRVDCRPVKAK